VQVPIDVATFLLNEKRSDIHRIESRLKVSITLIPNQHMETPHYNVSRLRQDDMTSENQQASYKLVERPEEINVTTATQETKAQRPQAAVHGITPAQPAPMRAVEATAQPSILGKFFGWIKSIGAEPPAEKTETAKPRSGSAPRRDREGSRPEGGKQDGNRQRNKPRRDRDDTPRAEKAARPEAAPKAQEPRAERPPRPPRVAVEKPALESVPKAEAPVSGQTDENSNRAGRKRGRRGGQRERERREQQLAEQNSGEQLAITETGNETPVVAVEAVHHDIAQAQPPVHIEEASHTEQQAAPVASITEYQAEPVAQFDAAPPAPVAAPTPAPVVVPTPVQASLPIVDSGLVQIETAPSRLAAVAAIQTENSQEPTTRRRARPREVYNMESDSPLVQIETQHKQN